jgi:Fic family protein
MPRPLSEHELRPVLDAFGESAELLSIEELSGRLSSAPPRRTLQRWVAGLVEAGRLQARGEGRGRRYTLPVAAGEPTGDGIGIIPLSAEARHLREQVRRPQNVRGPVGYSSFFLADYTPNVSAYLPAKLRHELKEMGTTSEQLLPAGTHLKKVLDRLLIDLTWNSSRLEGNTYSLLETQRLLSLGEAAQGKRAEETQMILNHKAAIELLAEPSTDIGFNRHTICSLHALLSDNLLPDPSSGGRLRDHAVSIGGSVFHPLEVPQLIEERFGEMLDKAARIEDAFEQSFFIMVHLPYLQPFEDVNKRTSRLAANIPLIRHNLGPLSFVDVPEDDYLSATLAVYELNRVDYLREVYAWAYERSCARYAAIRQSLGEPDPFRLRHRRALTEVVGEVVREGLNKQAAVAFLRKRIPELVDARDRARFMTMAENELAGLHEGNFARFRIRPSEFMRWLEHWK